MSNPNFNDARILRKVGRKFIECLKAHFKHAVLGFHLEESNPDRLVISLLPDFDLQLIIQMEITLKEGVFTGAVVAYRCSTANLPSRESLPGKTPLGVQYAINATDLRNRRLWDDPVQLNAELERGACVLNDEVFKKLTQIEIVLFPVERPGTALPAAAVINHPHQ